MTYYQNLIETHYKVAKRSGVPLINHINEGVILLESFGCSADTLDAYRYTLH